MRTHPQSLRSRVSYQRNTRAQPSDSNPESPDYKRGRAADGAPGLSEAVGGVSGAQTGLHVPTEGRQEARLPWSGWEPPVGIEPTTYALQR
jgi:hypothetical protein